MSKQKYSFAVEGQCTKANKSGSFRLCEDATNERVAQAETVLTLENAGYSNIEISKVEVLRRVTR